MLVCKFGCNTNILDVSANDVVDMDSHNSLCSSNNKIPPLDHIVRTEIAFNTSYLYLHHLPIASTLFVLLPILNHLRASVECCVFFSLLRPVWSSGRFVFEFLHNSKMCQRHKCYLLAVDFISSIACLCSLFRSSI
jgi:hypothetical protein